jgi:hypothetical protein
MDRGQDPVWTQCLQRIEPMLAAVGFRLASESAHYSSFGSAVVEYENARARIEVVWDGRDRWIDVRVARSTRPHTWDAFEALPVEPPQSNPRAHVLRPGVIADEYIENIVRALQAFAQAAD